MKFKLEVPVLTPEDKTMLRMIAEYLGYELLIDDKTKRYIVVGEEDIAYVQKSSLGLFIVWRKTEHIQFVKDLFAVTHLLETNNIIPENKKHFKKGIIGGIQRLINWVPGQTLNEELEQCRKA